MSSEVKKAKLTDEEYIKKLENALNSAEQRIDKAKELCKIVLDNEDKNQDLLDHISVIYRK